MEDPLPSCTGDVRDGPEEDIVDPHRTVRRPPRRGVGGSHPHQDPWDRHVFLSTRVTVSDLEVGGVVVGSGLDCGN